MFLIRLQFRKIQERYSLGLRVFLLLITVLSFPAFIFAETIIFKSGKTIEGKIIERTDEYIKIDFYGVPIIYYLEDIERTEGEISTKPGGSYDEEQIKSIIINYYDAFDNKNLPKWETHLYKNFISSEDGKYFIEEAKKIFSENMYIKTQFSLDKINFEIKEDALWVSLWPFRTCISSKKGMITATENKVILIFKKENGDWKIEKELQFLGKDNLILTQADDLLAKMKVDEAIEKYKEVITINPNLSIVYLSLMYLYEINNKHEEAIVAIQKAIHLRSDVAAYHYLLGMLYTYNENELENAKKELLKTKELDPNFPGLAGQLRMLDAQ